MKHHHDGITVGSATLPYSINRRDGSPQAATLSKTH